MDVVRSDSGLLIASEGADPAGIGALLRQYDPDLRLVPRYNDERDCIVWAVYTYKGTDRPSEFVCFWQTDNGEPLPLSSSIVDMVARLDKNTRSEAPDPDRENAALKARIKKKWDDDAEAIRDDWLMPHGRPILPRSQSLRRSRDKRRSRGEKC